MENNLSLIGKLLIACGGVLAASAMLCGANFVSQSELNNPRNSREVVYHFKQIPVVFSVGPVVLVAAGVAACLLDGRSRRNPRKPALSDTPTISEILRPQNASLPPGLTPAVVDGILNPSK